MVEYLVFLCNDSGRALLAMERYRAGVDLQTVVDHASKKFSRFVVYGSDGRFYHASNPADIPQPRTSHSPSRTP